MLRLLNKLWIYKILKIFLIFIIPIFLISCDNKGTLNISEKNTNNELDEIGITLPTECE